MQIPVATYRLQFNKAFCFPDAQGIIPYLSALGISHIYASPIFKARKGSDHGYDIVDPNQINPECGGLEAFRELRTTLQKHGVYWLQDIVPNHMAFDSENAMLMDVLEYGAKSSYFHFFDIDWNHLYEGMKGRLLAPFLGKFYAESLEQGEIQLQYDKGTLIIAYYSLRFPLRIKSYTKVFEQNINALEQRLANNHNSFIKFLGSLQLLKSLSTPQANDSHVRQILHAKEMMWSLYQENAVIRQFIDENIAYYNGEKGNPKSFNALDQLISEQLFRLSFWKVATEEINYRRFFTVNDLISLRVEDTEVFDYTHKLAFDFIKEGLFNGIRIDHIDGLYDPLTYLKKVREQTGDIYMVVEKILDATEQIPSDWPVQGTTGYEFLNFVNGILCCQENRAALNAVYSRFTDQHDDYEELLCDKKRLIIGKHMAGNIDNLAQFIKKISSRDRHGRDITLYGLRRALVEVMTHFPVYRTYINYDQLSETDKAYITQAIQKAQEEAPGLREELAFIEKFLLLRYDQTLPEAEKKEWVQFAMTFQQYTGPLMAKGFEDTFLYVYNRLISLNDVGGNPRSFGFSVKEFHEFNTNRSRMSPQSLNATSTHDTKRGEDVRARINVLSELPKEWEACLKSWSKINRIKKKRINSQYMPDENDEYFLYQTLIGTYPFADAQNDFIERIKHYIIKAVREAKVHTAWIKPDTAYEEACILFIEKVLSPSPENQFLKEFVPFQKKISFYGMFNSLSQTLLKATAPGIPDFYQGTELWELSLVDPDNRRPVDFKQRQEMMQDIVSRAQSDMTGLITELFDTKEDGRIKLFLTHQALKARTRSAELFQTGDYQPLIAEGKFKQCAVSFARTYNNSWMIVVAPRYVTALIKPGGYPLGEQIWEDTHILLPDGAPSLWRDEITGQTVSSDRVLHVGSVLKHFPGSLLISTQEQ